MDEAKRVLVQKNLPLVTHIVDRFAKKGLIRQDADFQDAFQEGSMGLTRAIQNADENRVGFKSYIWRAISNAISLWCYQSKGLVCPKYNRHKIKEERESGVTLYRCESWAPLNSATVNDVRDKTSHQTTDFLDRLEDAVKALPAHERALIYRRYGLDGTETATQKQIADKHGMERKVVYERQKKILVKLAAQLQ